MKPILTCLAFLLVASAAGAADPTYWQDVRPALRKHCIACHCQRNIGELEVSGGLALDSYASFMKAAKKPVVHPGKSASSMLLQRITTKDEEQRMPPGAPPLPDEMVALVRTWIDSGAAEGKKPEETEVVSVLPPRKGRRLPVSLLTGATPPAGVLGPGKVDRLLLTLKVGPLSPVTAVAFSPDGKLLAMGAYGHVGIWDLSAVKPVKVLTNVLGAVNDLKFSPDGTLLAVAGGQPSAKGDLRLFQTNDWKLAARLRGHEDVVASVFFSADGKRLASGSFDKTVRVWDLATGKVTVSHVFHSDFIYAVALSPDGKWIASASKDRTVKLADAVTGHSKFTFSGPGQDVMAVAFSSDGKNVISSGYEAGLYWWNTTTGERDRLIAGHNTAVHEICVSKDGTLIASAGGDQTVRLWDGKSGAAVRALSVGSLTYAVALSADNNLAASGSFDGLARLWDVKTGRHLLTLVTLPSQSEEPEWLAITPEGYAAGSKVALAQGEWTMAGQAVPASAVWKALGKTDVLARAAKGETVPAAVFQK